MSCGWLAWTKCKKMKGKNKVGNGRDALPVMWRMLTWQVLNLSKKQPRRWEASFSSELDLEKMGEVIGAKLMMEDISWWWKIGWKLMKFVWGGWGGWNERIWRDEKGRMRKEGRQVFIPLLGRTSHVTSLLPSSALALLSATSLCISMIQSRLQTGSYSHLGSLHPGFYQENI